MDGATLLQSYNGLFSKQIGGGALVTNTSHTTGLSLMGIFERQPKICPLLTLVASQGKLARVARLWLCEHFEQTGPFGNAYRRGERHLS